MTQHMQAVHSRSDLETTHNGTMTKVERYDWKLSDARGSFQNIHKSMLSIPFEYQRDVVDAKVLDIAANWTWFGCGSLVVAYREGIYWVVDGQHRLLAALRRSDIQEMPCMVFASDNLKAEAGAFLVVNSGRKPVTAIGKQKALVISGDDTAVFINVVFERLGLQASKTALSVGRVKCVALCMRLARQNRARFEAAMELTAQIAKKDNEPIYEKVLDSLFYLEANCESKLGDKRLRDRLMQIGTRGIIDAANRASAFYARGGQRVWAVGVLEAVNKGLRHRFEMPDNTA